MYIIGNRRNGGNINSNQTRKYSVTAEDYRHSVKPIFKPTFVDSYINDRGLFIFLSKTINTFNCNNSKLCSILLYVLCKTALGNV
jgi:hypothetical protein